MSQVRLRDGDSYLSPVRQSFNDTLCSGLKLEPGTSLIKVIYLGTAARISAFMLGANRIYYY